MTMIIIAVLLAAVGSVAFALAAVLQGRAVQDATEGRPLDPRTWLRAVRRPAWIGGVLCSGAGVAAAVVALTLAPVSLIQPIGVLAVPLAVVLSARLTGARPNRRAWSSVAVCVAGVALVIVATAGASGGAAVSASAATLVSGVVLLAIAGLAVVGSLGASRWQCPANAAAAAASFGAMCVLVKVAADTYRAGGLDALARPDAVLVLLGIVAAGAAGAWLCQRAYAVGAPEVVLGCLTVVDPLVAVVLGRLLLGEGTHHGVLGMAMLIVGGTAALSGVAGLTRHHPATRLRHTQHATISSPAAHHHSLERTPA